MQIDWWTLGLQTVNVLVLIWILRRFLFRPIAAMIEQRRAAAAQLLASARAAEDSAAATQKKIEQQLAGIAQDREAAMKKAEAEAEVERGKIIAAAHDEADRLRAAAAADIARARAEDAKKADAESSRLAVDIAEKLLERLPDAARIAGFLDGVTQSIAALPEAARGDLGADGAPINLRAARALSPAEADDCRQAITRALGRPVTLTITVDPSLIAGLEIDTPHAILRNSLRADLGRIAAALSAHGDAQT